MLLLPVSLIVTAQTQEQCCDLSAAVHSTFSIHMSHLYTFRLFAVSSLSSSFVSPPPSIAILLVQFVNSFLK